jgi:hypothetical protein
VRPVLLCCCQDTSERPQQPSRRRLPQQEPTPGVWKQEAAGLVRLSESLLSESLLSESLLSESLLSESELLVGHPGCPMGRGRACRACILAGPWGASQWASWMGPRAGPLETRTDAYVCEMRSLLLSTGNARASMHLCCRG